ncbi:MAG: RluA family pseudouridine synthase [Patescibacteria group bacterium]
MEVIYEDGDLIVVNKPPGISVHGGGSVLGRTLVDELYQRFPEIAGVGEDAARPGIVHRLDRDTSGVMVVARNQRSFTALKELFHQRLVEKTYLAIVCGVPRQREGVIDLPIGRLASDPTKRGSVRYRGRIPVRGAREASTRYRVLKRGAGMALVELKPKTGRMHQLRVHMAAIGNPVACDTKYGGRNVCCPLGVGGAAGAQPLRARAGRQLLHAQSLCFSFPEGRRISFAADPPEDFMLAQKGIF